MYKHISIFSFILLLQACEATQPETFQADRAPEDRTEYNGLKGVVQQQKDQNYLMAKELADKCEAAKIDLAVALSKGNSQKIEESKDMISKTCR